VLNRVESTEYSPATTIVYTHMSYPDYSWNRPNVQAQCSLFTYIQPIQLSINNYCNTSIF